ncbi:tetracycline resistance protein [Nitzschia inconspicua]|uniref:Tetracycline resistance protein n=1 Tax=Nitzschia inconspicua TaxID=303405 RepID=A0A9K3PRK3_9STRA|nr:tetracycline resistance protein [Nitzschia inconspicua]
MSLSSFSPRPTTKTISSSFSHDNEDDDAVAGFPHRFTPSKDTTTTGRTVGVSSPLSNPTLLGQLQLFPQQEQQSNTRSTKDHKPHRHGPLPTNNQQLPQLKHQHLYVLPVLLLEFLAIALTRAVLPSILLKEYGSSVYLVLGSADCIRGLLAFYACPIFGKLSDILGRRICLLVTVLGSCAPVCSLAFFVWEGPITSFLPSNATLTATSTDNYNDNNNPPLETEDFDLPPMAIPIFVILLSLSGVFSSTFTLVFAYISDSVRGRDERVSAYGLALATFGLSFTIGPMAGGYLANYRTDYVLQCTLVLTILDLIYIYLFLPESKQPTIVLEGGLMSPRSDASVTTTATTTTTTLLLQVADSISWSPWDSIKLVLQDPFLRKVGQVAFFYYLGLWAIISTLSLYAVQHFRLTPERLGELMAALGLSTMVAEAVLVRIMVPLIGEKRAIRIGLLSFALQCLVLGAATEAWQLFICVGFSMLGNLVYPSLSSLVSGTVPPESVGEALGAINGIKALTEGLGPLFFGALMTVSEHTAFPGSPYWLAGILVLVSYRYADRLPNHTEPSPYSSYASPDKYPPHPTSSPEEDYVHELEFKRRYSRRHGGRKTRAGGYKRPNYGDEDDDCFASMFPTPVRDDEDEEYQHLLSEIEESDEYEETVPTHPPFTTTTSRILGTAGRGSNSFASVSLASTTSAFPSSPSEEDLSFAVKPISRQ